MKTEDEIRAEFEDWCKGRHSLRRNESVFYINDAADFAWEAWESCQQLNDTVIAAKDAEIARLREALQEIYDKSMAKGDLAIIAKNALEAGV